MSTIYTCPLYYPDKSTLSIARYDTGTIGGIIAMDDWLKTFGTHDEVGNLGYYLATDNQSLVVSREYAIRRKNPLT